MSFELYPKDSVRDLQVLLLENDGIKYVNVKDLLRQLERVRDIVKGFEDAFIPVDTLIKFYKEIE